MALAEGGETEKGSPGTLSLHIHLQEQTALKLWPCARMFQNAQKTWSWKAENKEKMEAEICPYSPRLTAGHFAGRDCYLIRNPSHQSCLPHCPCIALTHSCLCSLQPGTKDPVRSNGKLEKDHVAPVTMQTQMKSACWGAARPRVCCEGMRT